ncbi:MAG: hypothetical protein ACXV79_11145, partial [Methylobacter sp.]
GDLRLGNFKICHERKLKAGLCLAFETTNSNAHLILKIIYQFYGIPKCIFLKQASYQFLCCCFYFDFFTTNQQLLENQQ